MSINLSQTDNQTEEQIKDNSDTLASRVGKFLLKFNTIPLSEKLFFIQYLGIMLKSGIPLSISLNTLAVQTTNKRFRWIIKDVASNVEKGTTFTESLNPHEKIFGQFFINMIESGEISGKLEEVLAQLYIQFKKQYELTSKVRGALTYPIVILTAMFGIGTFMMIVVVPQITVMFKEFNAELPLMTKLIISVSNGLAQHSILFLVGIALFIIFLTSVLRTYRGKYIFQLLLLKLPIFSPIIKKINLARFARTISSLLKTDIMIVKSFQITAGVLGNLHYRKAMNEMADKVKKGEKINEAISCYPKLFPPAVIQMVSVGEETGELDYILGELAQFYENEVDQIMNNLPSIIEPILILILGVVVGGMAVAIVMPMYTITSAM
ncbi:MAG: type II secretion system F family protein [bacterium]|nr:type II secretion system F family protein [bacterium]